MGHVIQVELHHFEASDSFELVKKCCCCQKCIYTTYSHDIYLIWFRICTVPNDDYLVPIIVTIFMGDNVYDDFCMNFNGF
jgi:hypothetical protein